LPLIQVDVGSPLVDAPLERVVREAKPSALLGLTGAGRLWDDKVLTAMGESCERPMIGPLSNPTDRAECTAEVIETRVAAAWV
jgi:malic enzyme